MKQLITKDTFLPDHKADSGKTNKLLVDDAGELISVEDTGGGGGSGGIEFVSTENTSDIEHSGNGTSSNKLKSVISTSVKNEISKGVTAESWGDHADAGYLTQHQDVSGKEDKSNKVTNLLNPNNTTYPTTKAVSDAIQSGGGGGIPEAPADGDTYGREDESWSPIIANAEIENDIRYRDILGTGANAFVRYITAVHNGSSWQTANSIIIGTGIIVSNSPRALRSVFIGNNAGYKSDGTDNVYLGNGSGFEASGSRINAFGQDANRDGEDNDKNLFGWDAGRNSKGKRINVFGRSYKAGGNYSDVNIFGWNIEPTKSKQNIISGEEFIMPESTSATIEAGGSKSLATIEWVKEKSHKVHVIDSNTQLGNIHHNDTLILNNITLTVNPTSANFIEGFSVSGVNDHVSGNTTITLTASSGWTYRVNGGTPVSSGSIVLKNGGTFTMVRKGNTNRMILNGDFLIEN